MKPDYIYLGDKFTRPELKRAPCRAVRRANGKCICGGSKMVVEFEHGREVVMRRLLRKVRT